MKDNQNTLVIPPSTLDGMLRFILEAAKNQGFSFLLMALGLWYFQDLNQALAAEIRACQEEKFNALMEVIKANTDALNKITYGKEEETTKRKK